MITYLLRAFVSLIIGFVFGVIGMLVGAWFGGNFATEFVFNGVRGYEATGQIGFILFALVGAVISWQLLAKKTNKKSIESAHPETWL
jgi:hypothetical protein